MPQIHCLDQSWYVTSMNCDDLSDVPGLSDQDRVENFRMEVSTALLDYCNSFNRGNDKVGQLLLLLSEIKEVSVRVENYLYDQYKQGNTGESNLLIEILHSNRP